MRDDEHGPQYLSDLPAQCVLVVTVDGDRVVGILGILSIRVRLGTPARRVGWTALRGSGHLPGRMVAYLGADVVKV
jgi:hypothetical protein